MNVHYSSHFLRNVKKLSSRDRKRLSERITWFQKNPFDPRLKTHRLTGRLKGHSAFSITHAMRAVLLWIGSDEVLFIDVGSHDDVYGDVKR